MPVVTWPWLALAGLGIFHGLNPAMGWLFAVALGLHRGSRSVALGSVVPIALGHALAIGLVASGVAGLGLVLDRQALRLGLGALLIGGGVYHHAYGARHRVRVGLRTGAAGLALWSFLMASAHGAGLMVAPLLAPAAAVEPAHGHPAAGPVLAASMAAVGVHTLAMLATTAAIALVVYEWVGLAFLRRGWINLDRVWTGALLATGATLVALGAAGR